MTLFLLSNIDKQDGSPTACDVVLTCYKDNLKISFESNLGLSFLFITREVSLVRF